MEPTPLRTVDSRLDRLLVDRFTDQVVAHAQLPRAREDDIRTSAEFSVGAGGAMLAMTCTITGSTYERDWDGSHEKAVALADEAAEDTVSLVTKTRHYTWLRSRI